MKILVITTGGTISSSYNGKSIGIGEERRSYIIDRYLSESKDDTAFDTISPLSILSESVEKSDLELLGKTLLGIDYEKYDGVIITCGSDTLAYIASFVALILPSTAGSVAIVCTNRIMDDEGSNALENFSCAVELIRGGISKTVVPYRNSDGVMYVHSAFDVTQADSHDDFYSSGGVYGVFENALIEKNPYVRKRIPEGIFTSDDLSLDNSVMMIEPYPFHDYDNISLSGMKSILHTTYHSGTLNSSKALSLLRSETPVFLSGLDRGRKLYETTVKCIEEGMIPLYNISDPCAYVKLLLAVNQEKMSVFEFMEDEL